MKFIKKKYLLIGIGIILTALTLLFYKSQRFICGDGVCHQKKEFTTGVCPKDCGTNTLTIPDVENSNQPQECQVKSIVKLDEGSFPKWSPDGSLIAFNKLVNNVYEIFTMKPDGTEVVCLTCGKRQLPASGHKGQPYWHPNEEYIVFTAQNTNYKQLSDGYAEQPDAGRSHNVWMMTADGENFWQLTDYPQNWGVIKPTFSNDGTKVFWNEEFSMEKYPKGKWTDIIRHTGAYWNYAGMLFRRGEELGAWRAAYADLYFENGEPKIKNTKKVNPPENFTLLEASGFTSDDKGFLYSYDNLKTTGGVDFWGDIYTTDLDGKNLEQLTFSGYNHDENGEYSPDGQKIAWSSALGSKPGEGVEIFLMDSDGENKVRLTHFTDKSRSEYLGNDYSSRELGWNPDGKHLVFSFGTNYRPYEKDQSYYFDNLYLLTFEGACGKL